MASSLATKWARNCFASSVCSLGAADVADAFHRLRISIELGEIFCYPPAFEFGPGGTVISGVTVDDSTEVFACAGSLSMGFSWSLYFCRIIAETRLNSLDLTASSRRLHDHSEGEGGVLRQEHAVVD